MTCQLIQGYGETSNTVNFQGRETSKKEAQNGILHFCFQDV